MLFNFGSFPALAEQISRDPGLIFVSGIILFVAGLAIVRAHNIWTGESRPEQRADYRGGGYPSGAGAFLSFKGATAATKQALAPQRQSDLTRRHSRFHTWRAFAGEGNAA
jgi:hypothetical protein